MSSGGSENQNLAHSAPLIYTLDYKSLLIYVGKTVTAAQDGIASEITNMRQHESMSY